MMYYKLPDGQPTPSIAGLIPNVISPQFLTDEELLAYDVARCTVQYPPTDWWQKQGDVVIDNLQTPHLITWEVLDRDLAEVKSLAWQKIKDERDQRQSGIMPYTYPNGDTHHNSMSEKVIRDLSSSTTAAIALSSQGVTSAVMPWTVNENVTHWLTPAQMVGFGLAAMQWHSTIHMQSQSVRTAINSASTLAEVVEAAQWPGV